MIKISNQAFVLFLVNNISRNFIISKIDECAHSTHTPSSNTVPQALVNTDLNEFSESGEVFRSLQNMPISPDKNYDIRSPEIEP